MLSHYLVKCTNFSSFPFFHAYQLPSIRDTDELRKRLVATWLNFSTAWWTMQLISGEKDCKHVPVQKVVTFNICYNVACLTFHLPHITTGSSQSHQCQPTTGSFQVHQRLEEYNIFSQIKKLCILQGSVVTFIHVWWVRE